MVIEDVGGIKSMNIDFNDAMNVICGPNGVGKTTILECVAHTFSVNATDILKRNVSSEVGKIKSVVENNGNVLNANIIINDFEPNKNTNFSGLHQNSDKLLSLKTTRTFKYTPLNAVSKDPKIEIHRMFEDAKHGININEVKNWFVNRYLYSAHDGALNQTQIENLDLAKTCFSLLNPNFSFSKVAASTNEIMVKTPNGDIYYEYLSSGFKSCLSILLGIIKEIEHRFMDPGIIANQFDGIILVDELEIHLHPEWQVKIYNVITKVFPLAQIIVSTHSPHIIQNANPNEIIALEFKDGSVSKRELLGSKYGFKGWSIEEVLTDVMGMNDTRTPIFNELIHGFNLAIDRENAASASKIYEELEQLLHPENHLKKLLRFQLGAIAGGEE